MAWDSAVITNTGLELYAQALQENGITITRAEGGYGTVPAAELREQTAVTPPGTAVPIVDVTKQGAGLKVSLRMNSVGLATGYTVKMLGIYAKSASGGEVLLAVVQDERGELIPPGHETPEYVFELTLLLLDYITGMLAAAYNEGLSSKKGRKGLIKKVSFLLMLGLGFLLDAAVPYFVERGLSAELPVPLPFGLMICAWIVITEAISVLENLCRMEGVRVPGFLVKLLRGMRDKIDKKDGE